jgi:NTE family protein
MLISVKFDAGPLPFPRMRDTDRPRVGLVLGAGGVLGGAWLVGALHAIATETGWDPGSADNVVGTSAGSMVGALLACGVPPWFMVAHSAGEDIDVPDASGGSAATADRSAGAVYRLQRGFPAVGPGSWRLAMTTLTRPRRYPPAAVVAGWLPDGPISTEPLQDTVRRACSASWAPHPGFWSMALDYGTGRRVAFGRSDAPVAELPAAVAASCAIPGFYRSVRIGGRRYVDGGVRSPSNVDVLRDEDLDLVIALNPTSSLADGAVGSIGGLVASRWRAASGRRLGSEAKVLRARGVDVELVQPTEHDLEVMGPNLMSSKNRHKVVQTAIATVTERLRSTSLGERLAGLEPGMPEAVRRPPGPPSTWPDFETAARDRWAQRPMAA